MRLPLSIFVIICFCNAFFGQSNFNLVSERSEKIKFQLINNLIVIPVQINGVELSFLFDSGVSKPILFNIVNLADSLKINQVESIYLRGLGGGDSVEALKSSKNLVRIGNAINVNQDIFVVLDESINFTPRLGVPVHGIIGYDIFKDLIVEVNYSKQFIRFHDPLYYVWQNCKKCETLNLSFYNNKPYLDLVTEINGKSIPVKLLIDSGGSDALWLFEDEVQDITLKGSPYFNDFLGLSLSGDVYGKRSKVGRLDIGSFRLFNVNAAFPDSIAIAHAKRFEERNGSIAGELLKRFNLVFDYTNAKLMLRKNRLFSRPFQYNKSGIILQQNGLRIVKQDNFKNLFPSQSRMDDRSDRPTRINLAPSYNLKIAPAIVIAELRKGSPGERAGLLEGDVVIEVNGIDIGDKKLQQITSNFYGDDGKKVRMVVQRNGLLMRFEFRLEPVLKAKSPQN